jgi:peptide/nickel transport system substrate-binding protein
VPRGTLTLGGGDFPTTLSPYGIGDNVSFDAPTSVLLSGLLFAPYFLETASGISTPVLLSAVPDIANGGIRNGGRTVVVHLRHGLRWSDGQALTSADIRFGWKVDRAQGYCRTCPWSNITGIRTPDRYTAVLHLTRLGAGMFPGILPDMWPVSWPGGWQRGDAHTAAQKLLFDHAWNFTGPVLPTDGPYQVREFVPDSRIALAPMPYYTASCGPAIASIVYEAASSQADLIRGLAAQRYDAALLPFDALGAVRKESDLHVRLLASDFLEHLELNHDPTYDDKPNPLANRLVRLALALAIDKRSMVQEAQDVDAATAQQVEASTIEPPGNRFADRSIRGQWDPIQGAYVEPGTPRRLADARILLGRTPYTGGFDLDLYSYNRSPARDAEIASITAAWKQLGVTVTSEYRQSGFLSQGGPLDTGDFQVALFAYGGAPDPLGFRQDLESRYIDRRQQHSSPLNQNYAAVSSPAIDRAFEAAARTADPAVRAKLYNIIETHVNRNADWIPLYFRTTIAVTDSRIVRFDVGDPAGWTVRGP